MYLPHVGARVEGNVIACLGSEVVGDRAIGFSLREVEVDGKGKGCVHLHGDVGVVL